MAEDFKTGTLRLRCPHCKRDTIAKIRAPTPSDMCFVGLPSWLEKFNPGGGESSKKSFAMYLSESWTKCPEVDCQGPIYIAVRWELNDSLLKYYGDGGWHRTSLGGSTTLLAMFPEGSKAALDPSVPGQIRAEWPGIIELAEQKRSPALVLLGCRAVLELAMKELESASATPKSKISDANRLTLQQRIDALSEKGLITHTLRDWAHQLRLDGNDGAHELKGDAERALTFARFVEFFLEATFVMQSRLESVKRQPIDINDLTLQDLL